MGAACAFLTQVLLARKLGPSAFGVFAAALALVTLATPLAGFGVGGFWLRAFGQEGWRGMRWLRGSLKYVAVTTSLVLVTLMAWAGLGPHDVGMRSLLLVLSMFVLGQMSIELVSAKLQLEERYFALAVWQFLPHFLRLMLVGVVIVVTGNLVTDQDIAMSYALVSVGVFVVGGLLLWRMYAGDFDLKGHGNERGTRADPMPAKQVALQAWPFGLAGIFYLIYFQSDLILLKYIKGDEAAGIYNVAFVITAAVYILPSVVYQKFLMPKIHRWAQHDRQRFRQVYRAGNWVMLVLGLCAMLAIWLLSPWGVRILFGERYTGAVGALNILALAAPIRVVATSVGATLVTGSHMPRKVYLMGVTATVNISLNLVLVPGLGIRGAAMATVASELLLLALYILFATLFVMKDIRLDDR